MCWIPPLPCCPGGWCGAGCAKYGDGGGVAAGGVSGLEGWGADSAGADPAGGDWEGADCEGAGGPAWKGCIGVHPTNNIASAQTPASEPRPIRVIGPC